MKNFYAIIGLSFGTGISNKYLAEVVSEIKKQYPEAKVILQKEIADYYPDDKIIISEHREKGKYLDTWEVLRQARRTCKEDKIVLVCHPDHLTRAVSIAKKLGFEPLEGRVPYKEIPYDPKSKQWWTRSRLRFFFWNLLANIYYSFIKL